MWGEMSLDAGFRDCFLSMSQTGIVISIAFHGFGSGVTITELGQTTLCRTHLMEFYDFYGKTMIYLSTTPFNKSIEIH